MHRLLLLLVVLAKFSLPGFSQFPALPLDTLLQDYTFIEDITPLQDGTFIIIGTYRGAVKVSRINSNTSLLWTRTLTDSVFYRIQDFEIHMEENDSTIQLLILKTECDIIPPGIASLFTMQFNGTIKDTVDIPFKSSYESIFLLSGNDALPRVASIAGDSIILRDAYRNIIIINEKIDILKPRLIDMAPSGKIIVHYNIGTLRVFKPDNGEYTIMSGGYASPDTYRMLYVHDNYIVLVHTNYISAIDSNGYELNKFIPMNAVFFDFKLKNGNFYSIGYDFYNSLDSFFVFDMTLNKIHSEEITYSHSISNIAVNNNFIYRVGSDRNYPYPNGHLEAEDLESHEGPVYYDIELVNVQLGAPDSLSYFEKCGRHYMYYYPSITLTIKNNSDFKVSNSTVGYDFNSGHCCNYAKWEREMTDMNLLPGETQDYVVPDFYVPRSYPFHGSGIICIDVSAPDNHADDMQSNNDACSLNFFRKTPDSINPENIIFYPNPTSGTVRFMTPIDQGVLINIFDLSGRLVQSQKLNPSNTSLDVENLLPGVYLIQFVTELGTTDTRKFVKS